MAGWCVAAATRTPRVLLLKALLQKTAALFGAAGCLVLDRRNKSVVRVEGGGDGCVRSSITEAPASAIGVQKSSTFVVESGLSPAGEIYRGLNVPLCVLKKPACINICKAKA